MKRTALFSAAAIVLAFAAGRVYSSSAGSAGLDEAQAVADKLAAAIAAEKYDDFKATMWDVALDEQIVDPLVDQLATPYKRLSETLGARSRVELIKTETAGPSIARYTYAELHTKGVILWKFELIKPNDRWKLHAYQFGPLRMDTADVLAPAGG